MKSETSVTPIFKGGQLSDRGRPVEVTEQVCWVLKLSVGST